MIRVASRIGLAIVLLWCPLAQAQELRAAPPAEPDVLRAAPDAGAVAQENRDIAGRWLGATDSAIQEFGKVGGTLTNASLSKFEGVSAAISKADWASSYGALSAGDVRGAISGAVAIKVGAAATGSGAALFGEIGAVTGGVVGSFFPVIGNVAGTMVGGAIGTAAGGFITAYGYDKYVKDYVSKGVVAGIASVFDKAPLAEAMEAKRAFLWATMSPEERAQLQAFNPEEVALLDFGTLPYAPVLKQPVPGAPPTPSPEMQQQAALPPPSSFLAGVRRIELYGAIRCDIKGNEVTCREEQVDAARIVRMFTGTISANRIHGTVAWDVVAGIHEKCQTLAKGTQTRSYMLTADGAVNEEAGPVSWTKTATCSNYRARDTSPGYTYAGKWRVLE